jgi:hypothetical protein
VDFAWAAREPSARTTNVTREKAAEVLLRMNTPDNAVRIV